MPADMGPPHLAYFYCDQTVLTKALWESEAVGIWQSHIPTLYSVREWHIWSQYIIEAGVISQIQDI